MTDKNILEIITNENGKTKKVKCMTLQSKHGQLEMLKK